MTRPRVTVLTAVYNGERHLRESVDSILAQTYRDFELLVVDDASTDDSRSILDSYSDERIRIVTNDRNLGLTASLNRGLEEARGFFVARHDADDISEPSRLALQVAALETVPSTALVASAYTRIDDEGRVTGERVVPTTPTAIRWRLLFLNAFAHSSVTMKTDVARRAGGYDTRFAYAQDYDLWSRLADKHDVQALPAFLVRYRRGSESMTAVQKQGDAVDETDVISRQNLDRLRPGTADGFDRDAAWRLLFGDSRALDARRALAVSRDITFVARSFARHHDLSATAALGHYVSVAQLLTRRVAALAVRRAPRP